MRSGAEALCDALEDAGIECVFGLPGTQTVGLYEALRRSRVRAIVPTHELGAAFMANGYARASGKVGVLLTIPGPGVAFAIAGIAEARLDGTALVHITLKCARGPTGEPAFQAIDQPAIVRPLVKAVIAVSHRAAVYGSIREALRVARAPDPGPVFVEIDEQALRAMGDADERRAAANLNASTRVPADRAVEDAVIMLAAARRPVILVASDCADAASVLRDVAESGRIPICVPPPSRGVVPEDHPWSLCFDDQRTSFPGIQAFVDMSDLVVVLGTRLGHVSTAGFQLSLRPERVLCVSATGEGLPHGYTAQRTICADPAAVLTAFREAASRFASEWTAADVGGWREGPGRKCPVDPPEPMIEGAAPAEFFAAMRAALPRDALMVTDSGLHQVLVRRHYPVLVPRGLIFPSDFQSMGFGLPAAIGAKVAAPDRAVLLIMGDGGFAMSGLELLTAARDRIPVIVVVFNDGQLNLIRLQQLREFGRAHGVDLQGPDLEQFAGAAGVRYRRVGADAAAVFREAVASPEATLIEAMVGDSPSIRQLRARSLARETVRHAIGPGVVEWLKQRLR
jgi:thiamine pyrophosphate-dependent acetolactate synthase large subunit-like protein